MVHSPIAYCVVFIGLMTFACSSDGSLNNGLSFDNLKDDKNDENLFICSSGVGAWGEALCISADGRFTGEFHDTDAGCYDSVGYVNMYYSEYSGHFGELEKINKYTYRATILDIDYIKTPGTSEMSQDGEISFNYEEAQMISDGSICSFFLKGTPVDSLDERLLGRDYELGIYDGKKYTELPCTVMYCEDLDTIWHN